MIVLISLKCLCFFLAIIICWSWLLFCWVCYISLASNVIVVHFLLSWKKRASRMLHRSVNLAKVWPKIFLYFATQPTRLALYYLHRKLKLMCFRYLNLMDFISFRTLNMTLLLIGKKMGCNHIALPLPCDYSFSCKKLCSSHVPMLTVPLTLILRTLDLSDPKDMHSFISVRIWWTKSKQSSEHGF